MKSESLENTGFLEPRISLPLDRGRRFTRDVVDNALFRLGDKVISSALSAGLWYYKLKGFVIAAKILGILSLILSIFMIMFWGSIPLIIQFGELLQGFLGFDIGEYIEGFLLGQFLIK